MKKLIMTVELEYDDISMHGRDKEGIEWFYQDVLIGHAPAEALYLHSGAIGDQVGKIKVLEINAEADGTEGRSSVKRLVKGGVL
jgi:hypothetical protein